MNDDTERLSAKAVRWLNRELAPRGLRVCVKCQGHPQPLDTDHFYARSNGRFEHECKPCYKARCAANSRKRYRDDPEYRARQNSNSVRLQLRDIERKRRSAREWKRRQRAARLAAVLPAGALMTRLRDLAAQSMPFDTPNRKPPNRVTLLHPNGRRVTLNETNETAAFIAELCKRGCVRVMTQTRDRE